ncbi:SMU1112c/YaeR family gloxylase I-like metalloprotein [Teredinibacter purpureus]|jgi:Lactoylglutathione lyase and related lyases|uniref:SMU1112c/YaeR family gloxylase I-like metalloprotein n=1 Tax=Teredinibacter purpureus TaxID=2731756 RepID=UPI0005F8312A|nr:VOC family protein [Teredinibacter purpureus]
MLNGVHHAAIICSDYKVSKDFYVSVLGLEIIAENYRRDKGSYKLDLKLPDGSQLELFSFPDPPLRVNRPEAQGLRHIAFSVDSINDVVESLRKKGVSVEDIRIDEFTGKKYTFFSDPDNLPLELYEN